MWFATRRRQPLLLSRVAATDRTCCDAQQWQVIFIGDENMVERLRHGFRHYEHTVQQAIGGGTCEQRPGGCMEEECPYDMPAVQDAEDAFEQGAFKEAADLFAAELAKGCQDCPKEGEFRKFPKWREATLLVLQARSLRRARELDLAIPVLHQALQLLPRYKDGWLEFGKLMLDLNRPDEAQSAFEHLLQLDRQFAGILSWLVRARADGMRAQLAKDAAAKASADSLLGGVEDMFPDPDGFVLNLAPLTPPFRCSARHTYNPPTQRPAHPPTHTQTTVSAMVSDPRGASHDTLCRCLSRGHAT